MKLNKKIYILLPILIAVILFIVLYIYFANEDLNAFSSSERKWLQNNKNIVENIEVITDYPIYGENGVFKSFINSLEEKTGIDFNTIPYYRGKTTTSRDFKFRVIKEETEIGKNDLFLNEDVYIALGKKEIRIDKIENFENITFGVFTSDVGDISYYLKNGRNLTYKTYDDATKMFDALDKSNVDMVIIPYIMYLDYTIANKDYKINYVFTEMSNKIVLSLGSKNEEFNNIVRKCFNSWKNEKFVEDYNKTLLNYYVEKNNINDKTRADMLQNRYTYGFVENPPYEKMVSKKFVGIAAEYLNRISRLGGIEFDFKEYKSFAELQSAINNKEIDIFFNYYGLELDNYKKSSSVFVEKYAVLDKENNSMVINSFESLKGEKVRILENTALYNYFKNNSKANIIKCDSINNLLNGENNELVVIDQEIYDYYKKSKFKKYDFLYSDIMTNDYYFMINDTRSDFYNLFNYIIETNSYYNYRNSGLNSLNTSILNRSSFEELYIVLLIIILVPLIIVGIVYSLFKKKKKVKEVKKEERKKYTDMLTSLKNRNYLGLNIKNWNNNSKYPQSIIIIDLNNVNYVNENYGYESGDKLILKAASTLLNTQLEKSEIIRFDGNEFLIYLVGYSEQQVSTYVKKLSKEMKNLPYGFGAAIGYSMIIDDIKTIDDAINEATLDMKKDKEEYK